MGSLQQPLKLDPRRADNYAGEATQAAIDVFHKGVNWLDPAAPDTCE
jgi:hypothetical protein